MQRRILLTNPAITPRRAYAFVLALVLLMLFAGTALGGVLHFYDLFWWWDDMLHFVSGGLFVLVALLFIQEMRVRRTMVLAPIFAVIIAFCFALTIGVLWEIFEFCTDLTLHTAMQQWDMPPQAIVMGASYQGMGLRDTMSDLIMATIGATLTVVAVLGTHVWCARRSQK